jgi:signal peptidase I
MNPETPEVVIEAPVKEKVPILIHLRSLLLSALIPGLGQLAKGQVRKASLFLTSAAALLLIQWIFRLPFNYLGIFTFSCLFAVLVLFCLCDALFSRIREGVSRPSLWLVLVVIPAAFIAHFEVAALWRAQGLRSFTVPSTSMEPTILTNESIVTDFRHYRSHLVERGDVIVFRHEGLFVVKRVIAVPGDSIQGSDQGIILNGRSLSEPFVVTPVGAGDQTFDFEEIVVPPGEFFVAGDKRSVSLDSRVAGYGLVRFSDIKGKALYIIKSKLNDRNGLEIR